MKTWKKTWRKAWRKSAAILLVSAMLAALLTGCGGKKQDGSVKISVNTKVYSLDPSKVSTQAENWIIDQVYEPLFVRNEAEGGAYEYLVCDEMEMDGDTMTVHLREQVKFHDGNAVTAEDVVYSLERCAGAVQTDDLYRNVTAEEKDGNVVFTAKDGQNIAAYLSQFESMYIVEKAYCEAHLDADGTTGMESNGTGAYRFASYDTSTGEAVLEAFEDYYSGAPAVKKVVFTYVLSELARNSSIESGELSLSSVSVRQFDKMKDGGAYGTLSTVQAGTAYLAANCTAGAFANKEVRQAAAYCVDKKELLAAINEIGAPADNIVASVVEGYTDQGLKLYETNVEQANTLLKEAGYDTEHPCAIKLSYMAGEPFESIALTVQAQLEKANFAVELEATSLNVLSTGNFELCVLEMGVGTSIGMYSMLLHSKDEAGAGSINYAGYSNARVDELFTEAAASMETAKTQACYEELQQIVSEDAAYIPLFYPYSYYAWNGNLKGVEYYTAHNIFFCRKMYWEETK